MLMVGMTVLFWKSIHPEQVVLSEDSYKSGNEKLLLSFSRLDVSDIESKYI